MDFLNKILLEDCLEGMKQLPDNCIDCCVTSPPYYGLRDYGYKEQIGMEETPELFVEKLAIIFNEVHRILKPEGILWLNLGDSYWGGKGKSGTQSPEKAKERNKLGLAITSEHQQLGGNGYTRPTDKKHLTIKPKDLIGIPWMVAFALRANGWYLRQDIIWNKPNPMPESVTDRCTKSHEYIFMLTKNKEYFFDQDAIRQPLKDASVARLAQDIENQKGSDRVPGKTNGNFKASVKKFDNSMAGGGSKIRGHSGYFDKNGEFIGSSTANKKSVWTVTTKPFKEAHFATFPQELIIDCIKAGCPENGLVLDPFMGAGTTAVVARKLNRNYVGFELNKEYLKIANNRLHAELGIFL